MTDFPSTITIVWRTSRSPSVCEHRQPGRRRFYRPGSRNAFRSPQAVVTLHEAPCPCCNLSSLRCAIGWNGEPESIADGMPLGNDSNAIAKLNEASRSRLLVIVDGHATALERMTIGKYETHFLSRLIQPPTPRFSSRSWLPTMRQHRRSRQLMTLNYWEIPQQHAEGPLTPLILKVAILTRSAVPVALSPNPWRLADSRRPHRAVALHKHSWE